MPNFKLKCEDSENIKADRVDAVVFNLFNLRQIKRRAFFFWGGGGGGGASGTSNERQINMNFSSNRVLMPFVLTK